MPYDPLPGSLEEDQEEVEVSSLEEDQVEDHMVSLALGGPSFQEESAPPEIMLGTTFAMHTHLKHDFRHLLS